MLGVGRTFQISEVPENMTVLENLLLAPKRQIGERDIQCFSASLENKGRE